MLCAAFHRSTRSPGTGSKPSTRRLVRAAARLSLLIFALVAMPRPTSAQTEIVGESLNLRDLLTNFLLSGMTLAEPATGINHSAHFTARDSRQFQAFESINRDIGRQISSLPLASSAGGFAYEFDPELGVFTRPTQSFGPIFSERPLTVGRGKFNLGFNYTQYTFDTYDDLELRDGEIDLVFQHLDFRDDDLLDPYWEGDLIAARMFLNIDANIRTLVATYGAGNRFDLGIAIPFVEVEIQASSTAQIQRLATGDGSAIHEFPNGSDENTFFQSGRARGLGDVVLNGKYQVREGVLAFGGSLRLPTGDERNLLGTGAAQGKVAMFASLPNPVFSPHINAGFAVSGEDQSNEIDLKGGFDWAADSKLTLSADLLVRVLTDAGRIERIEETFRYNTAPDGPQVIQTATFPLVSYDESAGINSYSAAVGAKLNVYGNLLLTLSGVIPLNDEGLRDDFSSLIGLDYSF